MDTATFAILAVLFLILLAFMWAAISMDDRQRRIRYGTVSILAAAVGFFFTDSIVSFQYNYSYSRAADRLLEASVAAIEAGCQADVLREWRTMDKKFRQNYETRGNFQEIAEGAIEGMKPKGTDNE